MATNRRATVTKGSGTSRRATVSNYGQTMSSKKKATKKGRGRNMNPGTPRGRYTP